VVLSEGESGKMTVVEIGIETIDITETTIVALTGLTEMILIEAVMNDDRRSHGLNTIYREDEQRWKRR
jgi:hypothetical protein